jgi:hypothetical protein
MVGRFFISFTTESCRNTNINFSTLVSPPPHRDFWDCYSKTCLKWNLKGPEKFSAKASFRLIKVHCLKRNLKGPEHFSAKARLNWTEEKNKVFVAMMTTAKLILSHRNMICAAIQVLRSRNTLALINQNKESIHDPIQSGHSWKLKQCTVKIL